MKEIIATENAPAAIGPYCQATKVGKLIFTAGQIGFDPTTMKIVEGGVQAQAKQALTNLGAILEAAGSDFDHVLKTTVFMRYMKDYGEVNAIYAEFFSGSVPARSAVAVSALPAGALVEIEAVAAVKKVAKVEKVKKVKKEKKSKKKKKD